MWICKTHYPLEILPAKVDIEQEGSVAVVIVRSFYTMAESYFYQQSTLTHNRIQTVNIASEYPDLWAKYTNSVVQFTEKFVDFWQKVWNERGIPVIFVRYEDAVRDKATYLREFYSFAYGVESIEGTYLDQRIIREVEKENFAKSYALKTGKRMGMEAYSEELRDRFDEVIGHQNEFFGYTRDGKVLGGEHPFHEWNKKVKAAYIQNKAEYDKQIIKIN